MIVAELKGGLGNNLFQCAAAIGHAVATGHEWGLVGEPAQPFMRLFPHLAQRWMPVLTVRPTLYVEPQFPYTTIPDDHGSGSLLLRGYFQSWRYFAEPAQEAAVRAAFRLPGWVVKPIGSAPVTGVHVRRGDYLAKPNCHPIVGLDYYHRAHEATKSPDRGYYVVVSDEPGWAREWLTWADSFGLGSPVEDFLTLATCRNVICANSTFSWWAAWLGRAERVVLPRPWFGPALPHDTRDLLPPWWQWLDWTPEPAKEPA